MKKIFFAITILISVTVLFFVLSTFASAETYGDLTYEVSDGEVVITSCNSSVTEVVIPAEIEGMPVTGIGESAFSWCYELEEIIIPESVTSMKISAFTSTKFYENDKNWDNDVFYINNHLLKARENISGIYEVKQGTKYICDSAFLCCSDLEGIIIPDSITSIGEMVFDDCKSLEKITVDENNIEYSSDEYGVLFDKDKTKLIRSPEGIDIKEYIIPNSVTDIYDNAFRCCRNLEDITISNGVTVIKEKTFRSCENLENINIPDSVSSIEMLAFFGCSSLESITIPDSVKEIGASAFGECSSLVSVTLSHGFVLTGSEIFYRCSNIQDVYFNGSKDQWDSVAENLFGNRWYMEITVHIHEHKYVLTVTTPATCFASGTGVYTCECSDSYISEIPAEHNKEIIPGKAATCTATGLTTGKKCSVCGEILTAQEEIPATGHKHTAVVTAPTCTEKGFTTYTCSCGDTYVDTYVDKIDHIIEVGCGKAPTCTEIGYTDSKVCVECGEILVIQKEIPATGHAPGSWEVVVEAQVGADGLEQQKCTVCGEVIDERVIPALPDVTYIVGDVNGDGNITAADARIILRISAKLDKVENYNIPFEAFDVIVDGKVNAADARKILRISAKLE